MKKENKITIVKEINPIIRKVEALEITNRDDMSEATVVLSKLNKFYDAITIEKEKLTKPLNETLKEIRSRYRPIEQTLDEATLALKHKMSAYQAEAIKKEAEAQAKIAEKVASGKMKIDTALTKMEAIESPDEKVQTDAGSVSFRTIQSFEVMDVVLLAKAMPEAVEPINSVIRKAMTDGKQLPGVRYFTEQSIINKRN